jgi:hypothetical protein
MALSTPFDANTDIKYTPESQIADKKNITAKAKTRNLFFKLFFFPKLRIANFKLSF